MEPIVYAVLITLMLVIAVVLLQNPERVVSERLLERHAHHFNPAASANVKRIVTIIAPPQTINAEKFAVEVEPLPLAADTPSGAGVKRVIAPVIRPQVRTKEGQRVLTEFDPPLRVRVEPLAADGGTLALVAGSGGKWRTLDAEADGASDERRMVTGTVSSLAPDAVIALADV